MQEWGNNPATVAAIGSILTLGTLIALFVSVRTSRRMAQAAEKQAKSAELQAESLSNEVKLRLRPWLFSTRCTWESVGGPPTHYELGIGLTNSGTLPAEITRNLVKLTGRREDGQRYEIQDDPPVSLRVLVPGQPMTFRHRYKLDDWLVVAVHDGWSLEIELKMTYRGGSVDGETVIAANIEHAGTKYEGLTRMETAS